MMRRMMIAAFAHLLLVCSVHAAGNPKTDYKRWGIPDPTKMEGTTPAQWRVLWTEDPQTKATVSWSTAVESKKNTVYYDSVPHNGDVSKYKHKAAAAHNGAYTGGSTYYHHATLAGLTPGTTCFFVLESDGKTSKEMHFKTGPKEDVPIKIVFGSDSRTGGGTISIIRMFLNFHRIAKLADADESLYAFAFGGDYVHSGTSFPQWDQWLSDHELTTSPKGRVLPFIPARGNHEASGPLYDEIFHGAGEPGKNWFAIEIGPELALVTLNSQKDGGGEQLQFLAKTLPPLRAQNRWLVAQYHVPLYPTAKYKGAPGFKMKWIAEFDKSNLDLGVESDGHTLKRTHLMRGDKIDPTGTLYIGEGGYGAPPRKPRAKPYHAFTKYEKSFFFLVEFGAEALVCNAISIDGNVVDTVAFPCAAKRLVGK